MLLTHRCDGAILSDRRGDGLSAVHAQAIRRYIELLDRRIRLQAVRESSSTLSLHLVTRHVEKSQRVVVLQHASKRFGTLRAQAVVLCMELLTMEEQKKQRQKEGKDKSEEVD